MEKEQDGISPVVIVVLGLCAVIGLAYLFIQNVSGSRIASNESAAIAGLRAYLGAQNTFRRSDYYGIGKKVYANTRDGTGFTDLYQVGGPGSKSEAIKLIDITFAEATVGGRPKAGYLFADITADADGPYDPVTGCGLCAVPASYNRSGRNIFIVDVTGTVYLKDAAVRYPGLRTGETPPPLTVYPDPTEIATWLPVGSE